MNLLTRLANANRYRLYDLGDYCIYLNVSESPMMLARARGAYEPAKSALVRYSLSSGDVFVDVGANKGDFTLLAASLGCRVISFEPFPENFAWLCRSIEANGFLEIDARQVALSDERGEAALYIGEKSGWHSLNAGQKGRGKGRIDVQTLPLDDLQLDRLDCLKIDVEGAEEKVLRGARGTLLRCRPIILMDLHPKLGADLSSIRALLQHLGYTIETEAGDERAVVCTPSSEVIAAQA